MTEKEFKKKACEDAYRICSRYLTMKRQLDFLRKEIIHGSAGPADGMPRGSGTGDPTARKAERLIVSLARVEEKIRAVEDALDALPDDEAKYLIRKNIFEGVPIKSVDVHMSESTCKRVREAYILRVAVNLGLYWEG